jgi:hypothetical protein
MHYNGDALSVNFSRGPSRKQFFIALLGGLGGAAIGQQMGSLALELKQRSASEGLALLRIRNNWVDFLVGGDKTPTKNPKGNSLAWFSANGNFIAWLILNSANVVYPCPGSIVVTRRDGKLLWQLPGGFRGGPNLTQTLALSQDGRRVAVYAANVSGPDAPPSPERMKLSLQWIDMASMKIVHIGAPSEDEDIGSIGWAPDGNSFVFDRAGKVFNHNVVSGRTITIADGADPAWCPDGKYIAFRTNDDRAVAINPITHEIKSLLGGRRILSAIHWSPDSKYAVVTEPVSRMDNLSLLDFTVTATTRIYRLNDMSSVVVDKLNSESLDDQGRWWFWVIDYPDFLSDARMDLPLQCGGR